MVKFQLEANRPLLQRRLNWLIPPLMGVFALLGVRLWWLQILSASAYTRLAEHNRIRSVAVEAPRGPILDRNRIPLVENRPSLNIVLDRELMEDAAATQEFVTGALSIPAADFTAQLRRNRRAGSYQPVVIKEDVGIQEASVVEAHRREHPEIRLGPVPRRLYRFGNLAAHVLGYIREVSEDDLENNVFPGVQAGDIVGQTGVERIYNRCLTGEDGSREVLVDSLGHELGQTGEKPAVIGGDLQLTLDYDLQARAEELLAGKVGVIVAMDPRNGEILAMADAPAFDPNRFSSRISAEDWNALIADPDRPLQNRAIQNTFPPGSIFKLVMAETGLAEGFLGDDTRVTCRGSVVIYNNRFHCWSETGHGTLDLIGAITHSCNVFFYTLGQRLDIDVIARHARALGFGAPTGIDLPMEQKGVVPSREWKLKTRGEKWYAGETISVAIGQGPIRATPLQVLRAVSCMATDGLLVTPHVLLHAEQAAPSGAWPVSRIAIRPEDGRKIREGMWGSVNNYGTSHSVAIPGLDICGKTGTVQVISADRKKELKSDSAAVENHAWFAGFASRDHPEIAVVVFLEHGGGGGAAAAPIAKEMFQAYYDKQAGLGPLSSARVGGAAR